jgi:hypothetical protein
MAPSFNLWFSTGGLLPTSAEARTYVQDIDWVLHRPDASLSPAEVVAEVTRLRVSGVAQIDTVPASGLPSPCDF